MKIVGMQLIAELDGCSSELLNNAPKLQEILTAGILHSGLTQVHICSKEFQPIGVTVISIIAESHVSIHTYPEARHASVDIFHCASDCQPLYTLLDFLKSSLGARTAKHLQIERGSTLELSDDNFITSPANRGFEVRYQLERRLFKRNSPYHLIEVIENKAFGRMLFMDGDLQFSEKDVDIYNKQMLAPLLEGEFLPRKIAILGGGAGNVLQALLKLPVEEVIVVDIDELVPEICQKYMPAVCSDAFEDTRAKLLIQDANIFLQQNHDFDAIICDLTMKPNSLTSPDKEPFMDNIFIKIAASLKQHGLLTFQCDSVYNLKAKELIRETLVPSFTDISFRSAFIPSYSEPWLFGFAKKSFLTKR